MVLAEVPLWMVHSSSGVSEGEQKALSLWQGKQKCAIYSIDMFPPFVATAGGDGTVKIWNSSALFPSKQLSNKGEYTEGGDYASSASGGTSAEEDASQRSEEDDEAMEVEQVHDLSNAVRRKKDGSPRKQAPISPPRISKQTSVPSSPLPASRQLHHRLLCTLSAHTGSSVLAVRFSPSGRYLASAGDDGAVCIYAPSGQNQWSRIRLCRGHGLDVVDLAWAPDDSHLVSCSLDSETPIIVWKLNDLSSPTKSMICNPFKVLGKNAHTSTVKGVDFDPAGSYFASSGDDPAVCIWRAHDDWGLGQRIDASSGIFRTWRNESTDDVQALSSNQSLFHRLSWSTDGSFLCATNAVVRNKNVASTISREGWNVSSGADAIASNGAANLVGHKQPIVVSRHATYLLDGRRRKRRDLNKKTEENQEEDKKEEEEEESSEEDDEPEAATLLALGDRRGFVTVWSTRKSRPIFKLQCSESRCTVTDLAWGTTSKDKELKEMLLLVSLLDGQVVAIKFSVPDELGPFLSSEDQARVFQLRYGIEMDNGTLGQRRKMLVGKGNGTSDLIENAVQMSLEEAASKTVPEPEKEGQQNAQTPFLSSSLIRKKNDNNLSQEGRKRARLVQVGNDSLSQSFERRANGASTRDESELDPMQVALNAAERVNDILDGPTTSGQQGHSGRIATSEGGHNDKVPHRSQPDHATNGVAFSAASPILPHNTNRVHLLSLPTNKGRNGNTGQLADVTLESTNSSKIPLGSKGNPVPCIDIVIKKGSHVTWSDQIVGTSCTALSASNRFLAIGTADGSVQLYGNSPSIGWLSAIAFRSHPPLIFCGAIVSLRLEEIEESDSLQMLVVTSDGSFGLYNVLPRLCVVKKGSLLPPMMHMALSASGSNKDLVYPKLSRIQITRSGQLLLLLSFLSDSTKTHASTENGKSSKGVGGSIQSFVYNDMSELWMRISDSRFVLSDFYSSLPSRPQVSSGFLTEIDDSVKLGALESTLKASHRNSGVAAGTIYLQGLEKSGNFLASRSHCEDRLACAVALESESEYRLWLARFVRILSVTGDEPGLRLLAEMIIGRTSNPSLANGVDDCCWWLSLSPEILKQDRKELIKSIVLPEMSKKSRVTAAHERNFARDGTILDHISDNASLTLRLDIVVNIAYHFFAFIQNKFQTMLFLQRLFPVLLLSSRASSFIVSNRQKTSRCVLGAQKAVTEMRVAELRDELRERDIDFSDCFDKESLCQRLEDVRNNIIKAKKKPDKAQPVSVEPTDQKAEKAPEKPIDSVELLREIRTMSVKALREDLASRSIRWAGLLEKEDLIQAVYKARLEALYFSATGRLVPGKVTEVTGDELTQEIEKTDTPLLLDVFATWCGPCQLVAPQLQAVAARMGTNMRVCKMDSDKEKTASAKLRIQGLPTLILFHGGKEVNRVEGALMEPQIISWVEKELQNVRAS